jgi:radical SAM protein with 4Fe4S-binding SPASM domain
MVIQKNNIGELIEYLKLVQDLGINEVCLYHMVAHEMELFKLSLFNYKEEANRRFDEARKVASEMGIILSTPPNFGEDKKLAQKESYKQRCFQPWKEILISHTGLMSPCCTWRDSSHGDIRDGLENVWNGKLYCSLRRELVTGKLRDACRKCSALFGVKLDEEESFIGGMAYEIEKMKIA